MSCRLVGMDRTGHIRLLDARVSRREICSLVHTWAEEMEDPRLPMAMVPLTAMVLLTVDHLRQVQCGNLCPDIRRGKEILLRLNKLSNKQG